MSMLPVDYKLVTAHGDSIKSIGQTRIVVILIYVH